MYNEQSLYDDTDLLLDMVLNDIVVDSDDHRVTVVIDRINTKSRTHDMGTLIITKS